MKEFIGIVMFLMLSLAIILQSRELSQANRRIAAVEAHECPICNCQPDKAKCCEKKDVCECKPGLGCVCTPTKGCDCKPVAGCLCKPVVLPKMPPDLTRRVDGIERRLGEFEVLKKKDGEWWVWRKEK